MALAEHSRPQSPRSFWSAPRIETSGRDRSRKSANHGLPAFVRSLRNLNNNGYYRLQKWAAIALARYLAPARGLDPWRRPKGSWALGTRMLAERIAALGTRMGPFDVHAEDNWYEWYVSECPGVQFKVPLHSPPQRPRSLWSAPRIDTSCRDRSRKSANHGLPAFVRSLRNLKQ